MIHFHGTPITPASEREKMAGKNFCVSFARPDDADWCLKSAQEIMWDNGAFTTWKRGKKFDLKSLYAWLEVRLGAPHWAVIPDIIEGKIEDNLRMVAKWPFPKERSCVVWHMNEPINHLLHLANMGFAKIAFGSTTKFDPIGCDKWERRADEAFNALAQRWTILPHIHMMRGLSLCGDRWPFASADSVNVAISFKRNGVCPERMARRIDAVQCPIKWKQKKLLKGFFF